MQSKQFFLFKLNVNRKYTNLTLLPVVALTDMKTRRSLWDSTSTNHLGFHEEFLVVMHSTNWMIIMLFLIKGVSSCQINKGKNRRTNPILHGKTVNALVVDCFTFFQYGFIDIIGIIALRKIKNCHNNYVITLWYIILK